MKLIVGLGNPEEKYQKTRHNVGSIFIDFLADGWNLSWDKRKDLESLICQDKEKEIILAKPLVFMNQSGSAVRKLKDKLEIKNEDIYIVHDELDLPLGKYLVSFAKSSPLHKGVISTERELKTKDFWRIRIGVDGRSEENRVPGEKYVLDDFKKEEISIINNSFTTLFKDMKLSIDRQ